VIHEKKVSQRGKEGFGLSNTHPISLQREWYQFPKGKSGRSRWKGGKKIGQSLRTKKGEAFEKKNQKKEPLKGMGDERGYGFTYKRGFDGSRCQKLRTGRIKGGRKGTTPSYFGGKKRRSGRGTNLSRPDNRRRGACEKGRRTPKKMQLLHRGKKLIQGSVKPKNTKIATRGKTVQPKIRSGRTPTSSKKKNEGLLGLLPTIYHWKREGKK